MTAGAAAGSSWAIVVAAGSGARLGADRPKAFVPLRGAPLVAASVAVLAAHPGIAGIVCAVPPGYRQVPPLPVDARVEGGASRAESVASALACVPASAAFVLVHDAARPLLQAALVDRVLGALAAGADGVVPALPLVDTIKRVVDGVVVETLDRSQLVAVQTPQGFPVATLRAAIAAAGDDLAAATDCAALVAALGRRVICVAGEPDNLKVTTGDDLERAGELLRARAAPHRHP
jgi:2-C-methyl-D-erythritol 4-phosphate cytidylyltransferase